MAANASAAANLLRYFSQVPAAPAYQPQPVYAPQPPPAYGHPQPPVYAPQPPPDGAQALRTLAQAIAHAEGNDAVSDSSASTKAGRKRRHKGNKKASKKQRQKERSTRKKARRNSSSDACASDDGSSSGDNIDEKNLGSFKTLGFESRNSYPKKRRTNHTYIHIVGACIWLTHA